MTERVHADAFQICLEVILPSSNRVSSEWQHYLTTAIQVYKSIHKSSPSNLQGQYCEYSKDITGHDITVQCQLSFHSQSSQQKYYHGSILWNNF